jgi:hypothetical protein
LASWSGGFDGNAWIPLIFTGDQVRTEGGGRERAEREDYIQGDIGNRNIDRKKE